MKFIVSSSVLLKNLSNIKGKISSNPIVPLLENFLLRVERVPLQIFLDEIRPISLENEGLTAIVHLTQLRTCRHEDDVDQLILELYKDNQKIYSVHHYDFERIVRRIFSGLGYKVTPTKRTRDGGYDMLALQEGPIPTSHLIECKSTQKKKKVGIEIVERFLFKINEMKASTGVIVTNFKFSADVLKKYATNAYLNYLKLIDGEELFSLLKNYVYKFLLKTSF